jgi:hypothetical protein
MCLAYDIITELEIRWVRRSAATGVLNSIVTDNSIALQVFYLEVEERNNYKNTSFKHYNFKLTNTCWAVDIFTHRCL